MFEPVKELTLAILALKASNDQLNLTAREYLEDQRKQRINTQEHAVNTARERHRDRMRAWRAAHVKTERLAKNGRDTTGSNGTSEQSTSEQSPHPPTSHHES